MKINWKFRARIEKTLIPSQMFIEIVIYDMDSYKHFLTYKDETWKQALDRFDSFCKSDMKVFFSNKDYSYHFADNKAYIYHGSANIPESYLKQFSKDNSINVPPELIEMLSQHGGFCIGDNLLEIFSNGFLNLSQILEKYGHQAFLEKIKPGMYASLSKYYYFFGAGFPDSDETTFLYFNKAGNFGKMLFASHNHELVLKKTLPEMFNGSAERYTLGRLISNQIDRLIINALTVKGYI